jgi:hypothetical protein
VGWENRAGCGTYIGPGGGDNMLLTHVYHPLLHSRPDGQWDLIGWGLGGAGGGEWGGRGGGVGVSTVSGWWSAVCMGGFSGGNNGVVDQSVVGPDGQSRPRLTPLLKLLWSDCYGPKHRVQHDPPRGPTKLSTVK